MILIGCRSVKKIPRGKEEVVEQRRKERKMTARRRRVGVTCYMYTILYCKCVDPNIAPDLDRTINNDYIFSPLYNTKRQPLNLRYTVYRWTCAGNWACCYVAMNITKREIREGVINCYACAIKITRAVY